MVRRPLAVFGFGYILSLMLSFYLTPIVSLIPMAIFLILLFLPIIRREQRAYLVFLIAGGIFSLFNFGIWQLCSVLPTTARAGKSGTAVITVLESDSSGEDGYMRALLQVEKWQGKQCSFRIYLEQCPQMETMERAELELELQTLESDDYLYRYADGAYIGAIYHGNYHYLGQSKSPRAKLWQLRMHMSGILRRYLSDENGPMAAAMIVGDRTRLDQSIQRIMRQAGISHLLVVSGLHLTMLCGFFWNSESRFYRERAIVAMCMAIFLMALTGFTPSVCRAGVTAILYYVSILLAERADGLTSVAVSAFFLCLLNPARVCDIGMQLSFVAAVSMSFSGAIQEQIHWQLDRLQDKKPKSSLSSILRFCSEKLVNPLLSTVIASLCVMPILLLHEMSASGAGVFGNLLTIWMMPNILLLGCGVILSGLISPLYPLYRGASLVLELLLRLLRSCALWCASLPFAKLPLPAVYTCVVLAVIGILVWLAWYRRRRRWLLIVCPLFVGVSIFLCAFLQKGTVQFVVVGNRSSPCLIAVENGQSAVLFRGGIDNCRSIENYLDNHGLPQPEWIIDIRQQEGTALPEGVNTLILRDSASVEQQILPSVLLEGLSDSDGAIAVLDVAGWQIAAASGNPPLRENVILDAFCAGTTVPKGLQPDVVLTKSTKLKTEAVPNAMIYWDNYSPAVVIRSNVSAHYMGGVFLDSE